MYFTVHKNELTAFNSNDLGATSIVPTISVHTYVWLIMFLTWLIKSQLLACQSSKTIEVNTGTSTVPKII